MSLLSPTRVPTPAPARAGAGEQPENRRSAEGGASPALGRREVGFALAAGALLALLTSWPLVLQLRSHIAPDLGDPVRTAWQIAWIGHALVHDPLHLFDSNAFYPHPLSLAFSDSLLGYGPAGLLGSGTVAALVRYNLLFLFAWALCFVGAYLLARELGAGRLGSAVAGVAFAYAPYRIAEAGHLHVISSGGIALALFLLLRGYRRRSWGLILGGWVVSAWQISLGFTLGLQYAYLLGVLALLAIWWWVRAGRPAPGRRVVAISCAGVALVAAVTVLQARPYLEVAHDYPSARRTLQEVERYSSPPSALLAASPQNRVWGSITASFRSGLHSGAEGLLFGGAVAPALALLALLVPVYPVRLRAGLAIGAILCAVLALGLSLNAGGYPYRVLYDYAPGWDGVRVPARIFTLTTLALALLAGAGAGWLAARAGSLAARAGGPGWLRFTPGAVTLALVAALLAEGVGRLPHPRVPQPARAEIGLAGPLLDLPTDMASDRIWQYFSTDGFPKLAQGTSTFDIPAEDDLRGGMESFPDRASVEKLRFYGIRTVVLHLRLPPLPGMTAANLPAPQDPGAAAAKPIAGLGITRRRVGDVVIYHIGPGPSALHGAQR